MSCRCWSPRSGSVFFALGVTGALRGGVIERAMSVGWLLVSGPLQLMRDLPLLRQWVSQSGAPASLPALKGWVVPLGLGAVFVALFAAANPVIANWLAQWNTGGTLKQLNLARVIFWGFIAIAVWEVVGVSGRLALPRLEEPANLPPPDVDLSSIFTTTAIIRSLVLFNLLFAVQTVMDVKYLWRGAALPDGMTYATYAHRGAYPLIVTALLAAGFVLAAMRPDTVAEYSPPIRALVFLWVGQNVLLVVSAIMRLNLYVETYLLTYWRVAAFIWMAMVAVGLILIAARILLYRSNAWLIAANLVVLVLTTYVCSFVNFASLVANYNVTRALARPSARPALPHGARSPGDTCARSLYRGQRKMGFELSAPPPRAARPSRLPCGGARGARTELAHLDVPRLAAHALSR